jgi:uncharacterized membrane protein
MEENAALPGSVDHARRIALHPLQAVLLAGALPLFLGALLSDWAYSSTFEMQWTNFASWLLAGALVFSGFALAWALVDLIRAGFRKGRVLITFLLLLATWVLGFINALVHSKDAWAVMPEALILSVIVTGLAVAAIWLAFSTERAGALR